MGQAKARLHIGASILILIGLVLLVTGLQGPGILWQIGLGVVGVAMLLSLLTRWTAGSEEEPQGRHAREEADEEPPAR